LPHSALIGVGTLQSGRSLLQPSTHTAIRSTVWRFCCYHQQDHMASCAQYGSITNNIEVLIPLHLTATGCHLPFRITQSNLPPNTSEHTPP